MQFDINKIYVLEIVKKIITLDKPQVFIFTHVWDDFVNLCYGKQDDDRPGKETPYRFYEIKKNANGSYIMKHHICMILRKYMSFHN